MTDNALSARRGRRSDFKKIPQFMAEAERQSVEEQGKTEASKLKEEPPEQLALF